MTARHTRAKPPQERRREDTRHDDPVPADADEFRRALVGRIASFLQAWRTCQRPPCRRARRCAAHSPCTSVQNRRLAPAPEQTAVLADLQRLLRRSAADPAEGNGR
jgi:hypothetical protein